MIMKQDKQEYNNKGKMYQKVYHLKHNISLAYLKVLVITFYLISIIAFPKEEIIFILWKEKFY